MIACRAESRAIFLLKVLAILAVAVGGFVSAPAPAQIGPPIRLLPPADNTEPPLPEPRREPPSIELADPLPIDADGVGLLDAAQGALPETLWRGSNRAMVERLIGDIPAPIVSPAVRGLALRVLASGGEPPAASAGALPDARSFVAQRAEKLLALGDVAGAASLARLVPTRGDDATLGRVLLDAAWFTGDEAEACGLAFEQIARFDDAYRQKSLIYCQAGRGEKERAQLGLRMMREQAADEDAGFAKLMALLLGESRVALDSLKQATPLHVVMTRAARQQVPADAAAGATPAVLAMIAGGTNASVDIRLGAAERAEAAGAIATAALAQAYDAVAVRPDDLARAIDIAGRERGPRARWLPYRAAAAQPPGAARLALLARYWQLARERNGYAAAARITLALLKEIFPGAEGAPYAGEAARILLLAGQDDEAQAWLDAATSAATIEASAADTVALTWPLLRVAGAATTVSNAITAQRLDAWRRAQQRVDPPRAAGRTAMLALILSALGDAGGADLLTAASAAPPDRSQAPGPNAATLVALGEAAAARRVGETALLAIAVLGGDGPANVPSLVLARAIEALRTVGLDADARALAVEGAILSGL